VRNESVLATDGHMSMYTYKRGLLEEHRVVALETRGHVVGIEDGV
jgi:hypothetical protein